MASSDSPDGQLRTLLVGIDAACMHVLDDVVDGSVPTVRRAIDRGVAGELESQVPPWTGSAWPSMYTGVNPGKHGVYDFLTFDGYDWDVVNRTSVREYSLWELAAEYGLTSVVVNVPVTHPPDQFEGALVPGYVSPEKPNCHPPGLLDDIERAVGEYRIYGADADASREERVETYRELVGKRGAAFRYLANQFDPDFGFVQFQHTDTVCHELPGDHDALRAVYGAVDDELDEILSEFSPEHVLIVSDHGIGEYGGYGFRVNQYLRNHGYVRTRKGGDGMPSWTYADRGPGDGSDGPSPVAKLLSGVIPVLARLGMTSQRVEGALERVGLAETVAELLPGEVLRAGTEQVDFENSSAYMRSRLELGVRINLEGREPRGVVARDDYEAVRDELLEVLSAARTPDGDPVFDAVLPREEVFHGPFLEDAPDVMTVPAEFDHLLSAKIRSEEFGPPKEAWEHKRQGIVVATGDGIDPDASLEGAHIYDVAPTVLASLGIPASDRMDGRALPVVESTGTRPYPSYSGGEMMKTADEEVERRLSDMGYLE
jgi:predicted AlkP superfamily phosphohydrolase/phosphomutase